MKKLNQIYILCSFVILLSCNISPEAVNYGKEACHFCKMTIVDKVHAAEIVTTKGKVYKFDSVECMIHFLKNFDGPVQLYLTNHYAEPQILIDATQATFLISEQIPSPMGANLTAFKTKEEAQNIQKEKGGMLYTWTELLNHLK